MCLVHVLCSLIVGFCGSYLAALESTDPCNDGKSAKRLHITVSSLFNWISIMRYLS